MKYKQVSVKVRHDEADLVSYAFIEAGSEGVNIVDGRDINEILKSDSNWDYFDESLIMQDTENAIVTGGFDCGFDVQPLATQIKQYIGRDVELAAEDRDSVDWENEWRKYYEPLDFGEVVIVPAWMKSEYGDRTILLEPGMAFGTGKHETTGMCIKLIQAAGATGKSVIDVGCGSGILGLAALKLGADSCVFVDNDSIATDAAVENLKLNGYDNQTVVCGDLVEKINEPADIVIANITADILIRLYNDLGRALKLGGKLILSGIIDGRLDDVLDVYLAGYTLILPLREKEWNAMLLEKANERK